MNAERELWSLRATCGKRIKKRFSSLCGPVGVRAEATATEKGGYGMEFASKTVTVVLIMFLVLTAGGVCLQVFLSKRESRWPGLVLPFLAFLYSLLMILNVLDTGSVSRNVLTVLVTLLAGNIPTLILLAIYWAAREKRRVKSQIDKMRIDDL